MKSLARIILAVSVSVLAASTASAQDAAAPMRRSSPPPVETPTPAPPSTPTPAPAPAATPAPQAPAPTPSTPAAPAPAQREAPAASRAPEPSGATRRETPSRRSVLRPPPVRALEPGRPFIRRLPAERDDGPRASRPTFDLSESSWATAATIRSLEKRWQSAIKNHDVDALDQLLADNFSGTSMTGAEASKQRMLSLLRNDTNVYRSVRVRDMTVRNLGPTTAVVTGTATESGVTEDGRKFSVSRRFTNTWRLRSGRWQCVSSRVTRNPER